jgi:4-hydroxy-tetrahydrodipicolinate reductase
MTKVIIAGAKGRMGKALLACAPQFPDIQIIGQVDVGDDLHSIISAADAVIDFSAHTATLEIARCCQQHAKALVIGTTGHPEEDRQRIVAVAETVPTVWASNFSTGVNALFWLVRKACEIMGPSFDLEIIETHHRLKRDAPSGTARSLAEVLAAARNQQLDQIARNGRSGITGERTATEIGIHAVRGGDVVGDHTVLFAGIGERLELTHKASSRETFANGALRAAIWVVKQKPGLYNMRDVLGLTD